ncbi:MAG TPA: metallopeptidase TldD-related protein, partial [Arenimonas sp.]|nr:metallopeptidase TldD-related protein [Arenimonas sp.]
MATSQGDVSGQRLQALSASAETMLRLCRDAGASQAEVSLSEDVGLSVNVRMGEVETVEHTRDRSIGVTVYFGKRKGSASTADLQPDSLRATVEQACAFARYTEEDPAAGLADPDRLALPGPEGFPEYDQWHPWGIDAEAAIALGIECESAGRDADRRIGNSEGAAVSSSESLSVYANSHGFIGAERATSHALSVSLIAGHGDGMQRDYWYTSGLAPEDLDSPQSVGRRAAERAVARLDPRSAPTGEFPVLFVPEMARSLIGHLLGAVSGGALYRRASFLLDSLGQPVLPDWLDLVEHPHRRHGLRSAAFDNEGVATRESALVEGGVLQRYLLGSYSARKLGLQSTGNAGGVFNLDVGANALDFTELLSGMKRGLVVTELMGQGANTVTGDYSRGA